MPLSAQVKQMFDEAAGRLKNFYDGRNPYDPVNNPGGFRRGGNVVNFAPALQDVAEVGYGIGTLATDVSQAALTAAGARDKSVDAAASATAAADRAAATVNGKVDRAANLGDLENKTAARVTLEAASIFSLEVNVEDYIPVTDNHTSAIRAAYNALRMRGGGVLKLPRTYVVKGFPGEKYILHITVPVILRGEKSLTSQILCSADTPADCDIILWEPAAIGFYYGIENLFIGPVNPAQPSGNNALRIKTTAMAYLENPFIEDAWLWGGNGYGIYQESTAPLNAGAGTVHQMVAARSKFTGLLGGAMFTACGDNLTISDCGVSGSGRGLTIVGVSGTARVKIDSLNSRAMKGGAIKLVGTDQAQIIDGQLEQFEPYIGPAAEAALIVLEGAVNTEIKSSVNGFGNIENCLLLKNGTRGTRVGKGTFVNRANQSTGDTFHITMAAGCGTDNVFDQIDYIYNDVGDVARFRNQSTNVATHLHTKNVAGRISQSFGATRTSAAVFDGSTSAFSWVIAAVEKIVMNATAFYPSGDNSMSLGGPVNRFTQLFAATTTISTSDARDKTGVAALSRAEIAAARDLAREIGGFRFLAAVVEKGDGARVHIGMTVQRAIEIMESHGLDPFGYAFICHDAWDAEDALYEDVLDTEGQPAVERRVVQEAVYEQVFAEGGLPTGTTRLVQEAVYEPALNAGGQPTPLRRLVRPAVEAGDRYGFRTDQLLLFIAAGFEARLSALETA